jgi:cytochrome c1
MAASSEVVMRKWLCALRLLLCLAGAAFSGDCPLVPAASAQPAGGDNHPNSDDVRAGRTLSLKVCTACHVVSPEQDMPPILRPPAPSFRAIANRRNTSEESVRRFLTETHSTLQTLNNMPNPDLTDDQVREAAAFIVSLKSVKN